MKFVVTVLVAVVIAACGESTTVEPLATTTTSCPPVDPSVSDECGYVELDEDIDAGIAVANRADVALDVSLDSTAAGSATVTASVQSIDKSYVSVPAVAVELSSGVTLASVPAGCEATGPSTYSCSLQDISTGSLPSLPETIQFELAIAAGTDDPTVTITASSADNPVTNDPDPTNNTITTNLG